MARRVNEFGADLVAELTEAAFNEVHTWRAALKTRPHLQHEIREREAWARRARIFQPSVVPGLLQIAEYARRVFTLSPVPYGPTDIAEALAGRLDRQLALFQEGKRFDFLITEAALRWRPGSAKFLVPQLDRIASLSTLDTVSIGLIPQTGQAITFVSHGFVIYGDPNDDEDAFVEAEMIHANLIINDPTDVRLYEERWSQLNEMAIFDDLAREFLVALAAEFEHATG